MPIRVAFIGCGLIAEEHLRAIEHIDGLLSVAYCDIDRSRAERLLGLYGGSYATDDLDRLLGDDQIDAVYICTHHDSHMPIAVMACTAGKHIMMEKPLALTLEDCTVIQAAVVQSGVTMMTAFKLRYYPMVERARQFIAAPVMVIAQLMDARWPDSFWAQDPVKGGGNLLSQGVHAMDMLRYLMRSEPVRIYAEGGVFTHGGGSINDTFVATVLFENGRIASLAQSDAGETPYVSKFSFQVVDGVKSVHLHNRLKSATFFDGHTTETLFDEQELGMIAENREFLRALQTGTQPASDVRDGVCATAMVLKAFDAIRTGMPQEMNEEYPI